MGVIFQNQLRQQIIEPAIFNNLPNSQTSGTRVLATFTFITYNWRSSFYWMVFDFMIRTVWTPEQQQDIDLVMREFVEVQRTWLVTSNYIQTVTFVPVNIYDDMQYDYVTCQQKV